MFQQPRNVLSLCPLNLILLPSSLRNREGIYYSSPGVGSTCQFSYSYKIALTTVCALAHFSFVLLLLEVLLRIWGSSGDLFLSLFFSGGFLAIFLPFESTLKSPATRAWSLEGLIVPIITNLSCSLCERFHEICKARHFLGSSCQLCGMEGRDKH